jgi:hypothetical protein
VLRWSFRGYESALGSFLRRDELDFARMSANSFEVATFSGGVLGTNNLTTPVLLHSQ